MEYLTVKEFSKRIKLHPVTVRRAIHKGHIYAMKVGKGKRSRYRIAESELERLQIQGMCENNTGN